MLELQDGRNKMAGWVGGWLAGWLSGWLAGKVGGWVSWRGCGFAKWPTDAASSVTSQCALPLLPPAVASS